MKCPYCGAHLRKKDRFCSQCGKPTGFFDDYLFDEPAAQNPVPGSIPYESPAAKNSSNTAAANGAGAGSESSASGWSALYQPGEIRGPYDDYEEEERQIVDSINDTGKEKGSEALAGTLIVLFFVFAAAAAILLLYFHPEIVRELPGITRVTETETTARALSLLA